MNSGGGCIYSQRIIQSLVTATSIISPALTIDLLQPGLIQIPSLSLSLSLSNLVGGRARRHKRSPPLFPAAARGSGLQMASPPSVSLFSLFLLVASSLAAAVDGGAPAVCSSVLLESLHQQEFNGSSVVFPLHDVHSPCIAAAAAPEISSAELLRRDQRRVEDLNTRLSAAADQRKPFFSNALSVPLNPGLSVGVGNYVTKVGLGTPSRDYLVVVDTGSSLSWVQCKPCSISCYKQTGPIFDPSASSSYSSVSCSAKECSELQTATLNPPSCSRSKVCIYQASYGDGSFSVGYLSKETLKLGGAEVSGFIHGCGEDNEGLFGSTAGLFGLAKNKLSLLYQLGPKLGYSFSYCLPSKASSGFLSIGAYNPGGFSFTPLVANSLDASLYFLKLQGISVGRKPLAVKSSAYSSVPTIIDSGTVITRLPADVYAALSKAVVGSLAKYPRAPAYSILDTCFKGSLKSIQAPEVSLVFAGGAELKLSAGNLLYDVSSTTTCLAFAQTTNIAIIGNRQHQTFKTVYDLSKSRIGFASGGCS